MACFTSHAMQCSHAMRCSPKTTTCDEWVVQTAGSWRALVPTRTTQSAAASPTVCPIQQPAWVSPVLQLLVSLPMLNRYRSPSPEKDNGKARTYASTAPDTLRAVSVKRGQHEGQCGEPTSTSYIRECRISKRPLPTPLIQIAAYLNAHQQPCDTTTRQGAWRGWLKTVKGVRCQPRVPTTAWRRHRRHRRIAPAASPRRLWNLSETNRTAR